MRRKAIGLILRLNRKMLMDNYALRIFATIAVLIGFIIATVLIFALVRNFWLGLLLVALLAPFARVIGDALNPDVANPHTIRGYLRRFLGIALFLALLLLGLIAMLPFLALSLGILFAALLAVIALIGLIIFALQAWLGLEIARPIPPDEAQATLFLLGFSLLGGLLSVGILAGLRLVKAPALALFDRVAAVVRWLLAEEDNAGHAS